MGEGFLQSKSSPFSATAFIRSHNSRLRWVASGGFRSAPGRAPPQFDFPFEFRAIIPATPGWMSEPP
jgi:hypothetical protein